MSSGTHWEMIKKRRSDWHSRYVAFIDEMRTTPFEWGTNDCGPAWAGRVVEVLTESENPFIDYQGRYTTMRGAIRLLRNSEWNNLKDFIASKLGKPLAPMNGYIGDIAAIKDDSAFGYSLGIVNGERVFFRRPEGIGTLDLLECDSVFKI